MSLRRNFAAMMIGRAVYAVSQWALLISIARLSSPEALGSFAFALGIVNPILILTLFNMRAYMVTDASQRFAFEDYLSTRIVGVVLALVLTAAAGAFLAESQSGFAVVLLVAGYKTTEAISDIFYGTLQQQERMIPIARSVALHGIAAATSMAVLLAWTGSVQAGAAAIGLTWIAILVVHDYAAAKAYIKGHIGFVGVKIMDVVRACYRLGIALGLMSLRINTPVYFVAMLLGSEQVGYYSAAAYFLIAGNMVSGSLLQAAAPSLSQNYHAGDKALVRAAVLRLCAIGGLIGFTGIVVAGIAGEWILAMVYGRDYGAYADVLIWVMVAALAGYVSQFFGLSLTVARVFQYQILGQALGVVTVVALCWALIPRTGLTGAAMALAAATVVTLICNATVFFVRVLPSLPPEKRI